MKFTASILLSLTVMASSLGFSAPRFDKPSEPITADNTAFLVGVMDNELGNSFLNQLFQKSQAGTQDLNILIDSPGGSVYVYRAIARAMAELSASGVKITCYVRGMAASAAFMTLTHCDTRKTYAESYLMFHRGAYYGVPGRLGVDELTLLLDSLKTDNILILDQLKRTLRITNVEKYYISEYMWNGRELAKRDPNFISLVSDREMKELLAMIAQLIQK